MLSGRRAFGGASPLETLSVVLTEQPAPLPAGVPLGLARVVHRCLAKKPADRYGSVGELVAELDALRRAEASTSSSESAPTAGVPTRARSLAVLPFLNLSGDPGQ